MTAQVATTRWLVGPTWEPVTGPMPLPGQPRHRAPRTHRARRRVLRARLARIAAALGLTSRRCPR